MHKTGIIGTGTMGSGIAQLAASSKEHVILYDENKSAMEKAQSTILHHLERLCAKGKIDRQDVLHIMNRIEWAKDLHGFKNCDLIIEAVAEDLKTKQHVFNCMEKFVSENCLIATNTSSLSVTAIASVCIEPGRVLGAHFFNPAPLMPLVEIVCTELTHQHSISSLKKRLLKWGKVPVTVKDTPGFIVNRIARPFYGEALHIYEEGMADCSTIDWAMKKIGGFKMGPFELMDFIGIDVNYAVTESIYRACDFDPRYKPFRTQKKLLEAGLLGKKYGRGFYGYSEDAQSTEPDRDIALGTTIFERILFIIINEAIDALHFNRASRDDIDLAMTRGVNYPDGPLHWADSIGLSKVLHELEKLYSTYKEARYRPSPLLVKMSKHHATFY